jgi:predicted nucleic acid-binding protein
MPEGGRIVVSDTTPLIALAVIDRIEILGNLYGEIRVPRAVLNKKEGMISEVAPLLSELKRGGIWLGQGLVQEALNLAGE